MVYKIAKPSMNGGLRYFMSIVLRCIMHYLSDK